MAFFARLEFHGEVVAPRVRVTHFHHTPGGPSNGRFLVSGKHEPAAAEWLLKAGSDPNDNYRLIAEDGRSAKIQIVSKTVSASPLLEVEFLPQEPLQ